MACLSNLCVADDAGDTQGTDAGPGPGGQPGDGDDAADDETDNAAGDAADSADDAADSADDAADAADSADSAEPDPSEGSDGGNDDGVGSDGPCCEVGTLPGCSDAAIEACVCQADAYCCDTAWDQSCVGGSVSCGQQCPVVEADPCCVESASAGCDDPVVEACVCDVMPDCCTTAWSLFCLFAASSCGLTCV